MKRRLFRALVLVLSVVMLVFPLASCTNSVDSDEAKKTVEDFFKALSKDDYESIAALMHPDKEISAEQLGINMQMLEHDEGVDFSLGVKKIKYTEVQTSVYSKKYDGSRYELSGTAEVGDDKIEFEIEILKNNDGKDYGIYEIDIDVENEKD